VPDVQETYRQGVGSIRTESKRTKREALLDAQRGAPASRPDTVQYSPPSEASSETSPVSERRARLRALWAKSDAAIAGGMATLTIDEINAEVAELRGNNRGGP
jgi:hypothetical protein